jgi:hypothetical protein
MKTPLDNCTFYLLILSYGIPPSGTYTIYLFSLFRVGLSKSPVIFATISEPTRQKLFGQPRSMLQGCKKSSRPPITDTRRRHSSSPSCKAATEGWTHSTSDVPLTWACLVQAARHRDLLSIWYNKHNQICNWALILVTIEKSKIEEPKYDEKTIQRPYADLELLASKQSIMLASVSSYAMKRQVTANGSYTVARLKRGWWRTIIQVLRYRYHKFPHYSRL